MRPIQSSRSCSMTARSFLKVSRSPTSRRRIAAGRKSHVEVSDRYRRMALAPLRTGEAVASDTCKVRQQRRRVLSLERLGVGDLNQVVEREARVARGADDPYPKPHVRTGRAAAPDLASTRARSGSPSGTPSRSF